MISCFFLFVFAFLFAGCGDGKDEIVKLSDLAFTVVEEAEVPESFLAKIKEHYNNPFRFTYETEGYLYIAEGYGTKSSGGYSIVVKEVFLTENAVYFDSELTGPAKNEPVIQTETHPFIVIKLKETGLPVVFW